MLSLLALVLSACGTGGSSAGSSLASTFTLGGPPECPNRPFCAKGLKDKYGMTFKEDQQMAIGLRYNALKNDQIQVVNGYSTDGMISALNMIADRMALCGLARPITLRAQIGRAHV